MVKKLLLLVLFSFTLHAATLMSEVENIIGKNSYIANKKIVRILFKEKARFYKSGHLDYPKVLEVLKENNLLNLKLSRSTRIDLSFATRQKYPVAFIYLVKSALNELGLGRVYIQKVIHDRSGFLYKVYVYSDTAPDPIAISESLGKKGAEITRIKRFSISNWRYFVDIRHLNLVPQKLAYKQKIHLPRPLEPYWINVENVTTVLLKSAKTNLWHPRIVFYDRYLNVLDNDSQDRKSYNIRLEVPKDAMYMKVSDLYTLENLRHGLTIYLVNRR